MERSASEIKKERLRIKLRVEEQNKMLLSYWLPYIHDLKQAGISFQHEYFLHCTDSEFTHWETIIENEPWSTAGIDKKMIRTEGETFHEILFRKFPSTLPLRFRPDLPPLQSFGETLEAEDLKFMQTKIFAEDIFLVYARFPAVLRLKNLREELSKLPLLPLEDAIFINSDMNIILFRSLEDEWLSPFAGQQL